MIILRQNGFLRSLPYIWKDQQKKEHSQTYAVQGLQVPPQNTKITPSGQVGGPKISLGNFFFFCR